MNQLIQKLGEYYDGNGLDVVIKEELNVLNLKQRILTPGGFLRLDIFVSADKEDYRNYHFSCYGLGNLSNATKTDLFRIELFNENQDEIKIYLDEKDRIVMRFDKLFYNITPYDLGLETMGDAMKYIASFQTFIKNNYQELRHIIRSLR